MVKVARQLKAGSCHVLNGDADGVKIRGRIGDFQIKFLYQRFQRHTVCIRHGFHPESKLFPTIIRTGREYQYISKKQIILKKTLAFYREI